MQCRYNEISMEIISKLSIEDRKALANILFFVSATIVAWLSYIAAKKQSYPQ
jgi:hypothetical protein